MVHSSPLSVIGWIDRIADLLQSRCDEFNQTAGGALYVSMTQPAFVEAEGKQTYQARLSASFWDLIIRGRNKTVEFFFVPAERVIFISRSARRLRASARMKATTRGAGVVWKLDGRPVADDSLETLCRDLFTTLIHLYLDEDHPAQVRLRCSRHESTGLGGPGDGHHLERRDEEPVVDLGTYLDVQRFLSKLDGVSAPDARADTDWCRYALAADSVPAADHADNACSLKTRGRARSLDAAILDLSEMLEGEIEALSAAGAQACLSREFGRAKQTHEEVVRLIALRRDLAFLAGGSVLQDEPERRSVC